MFRVEERISDKGEKTIAIFNTLSDGTELGIPNDAGNSDYQRYLRWLENPEAEENGTIS